MTGWKVIEDDGGETATLRTRAVPGGTLYRLSTYGECIITFVPDPVDSRLAARVEELLGRVEELERLKR